MTPADARVVGVDIGGTFTDCVAVIDGAFSYHKLPSTPPDFAAGLLAGLEALGGVPKAVVHGTTVATNALLERRGAACGLVCTEGFRDVLEIGRQDRPQLYALEPMRPAPLVPRERRHEVPERIAADGSVLLPLDESAVADALDALVIGGVESVAVCLLFSFLRPEHERRIGELAAARGLHVSLSSSILPEFREYERTATTVVNAYVGPLVSRYLGSLQARLGGSALTVMQSNGGCIDADTAGAEAVRTVLSGPAAGVVGAWHVGRAAGFERLVTLDMGGTSTDVAVLDGGLPLTAETSVAGLPVGVPMLDIHTVGAGGGSIARRDDGGALAVGPESAGAVPGPACYGRGGTLATVTDAHIVLGHLPADGFLGGRMRLDQAAAEVAVDQLAAELGLDRIACARGIVAVADAATERAVRVMTVERGHDPADYALMCFGGAGGLHAAALARALGIRRVLIPPRAGSLSALGLLLADVVRDASRTVMRPLDTVTPELLRGWLDELVAGQRGYFATAGIDDVEVSPSVDLRYRGQSFELPIGCADPRPTALAAAFGAAHARRYGYRRDEAPLELVTVRARLVGKVAAPELPRRAAGPAAEPAGGAAMPAYDLEALVPGQQLTGPAILTGADTTVLLPSGVRATTGALGEVVLETG